MRLAALLAVSSVIWAAAPPGVVIDYLPASAGLYIGSPSIAILPNGDYVASHDVFGPKSGEFTGALTRIFLSHDRGRTWQMTAEFRPAFWSNLFVHRGSLYLLGTSGHYGNLVIRRSTDGGKSWTQPVDDKTGLLMRGTYHCAPMPVVEHNGRLWRAMEDTEDTSVWGKYYRAFMLSVPVDADLLLATSWTGSRRVARDPVWLDGKFEAWLEGNAVVTPKGEIVDILRVETPAGGKAAIVQISADGKDATFNPTTGIVDFPGAAKKFVIRHDKKSGLYWALANWVPARYRTGKKAAGLRNVLALVSSPDLHSWTVRTVLLHHEDVLKHGFQYPDWQFDGNDIIAAVRTAFDDDAGGAHNAHDANYLTFHRFRNFRKLTWKDSVVKPADIGEAATLGK
jgi:hypothetical protein